MGNAIAIIQALVQMAEVVSELVKEGLSDEEILERLAAPDGVGKDLLDACKVRKTKLDTYKKTGR